MDLTALLIQIIVNIIIIAPVLWIAGGLLAGKDKAKFTDAIWIVVLGAILGTVISSFLSGLVGALVSFIVWLALIKHFFDCGWLKAFVITILAVITFMVIGIVLALIGIAVSMII